MIAKTFEEKNTVIGLHDPRFSPIPAHINKFGDVTACLKLTPREITDAVEKCHIWIQRYTFGKRMQPFVKSLEKPVFKRNENHGYHTNEMVGYLGAVLTEGWVAIRIALTEENIEQIKETRCIWLTTITYGNDFQPFEMTTIKPR